MRLQENRTGLNDSLVDEEYDVNYKIIVFTIIASEKMNNTPGIWQDLKSTIIEELQELIDPKTGKAEDVIVCLNIHTKSE